MPVAQCQPGAGPPPPLSVSYCCYISDATNGSAAVQPPTKNGEVQRIFDPSQIKNTDDFTNWMNFQTPEKQEEVKKFLGGIAYQQQQDQSKGIRERVIDVARAEIGTVEAPRGSNRGERIERYRTAVTGKGENPKAAEPWCADFISFVFKSAGAPIGFDEQGTDWVVQLKDWADRAGRYHDANSYTPLAGDIILFDYDKNGINDHTGVIERIANGRIYTIEGNSADSVRRRDYGVGASSITGFVSAA